MCGRFALHAQPEVIALLYGLSEVPAYPVRYNIAPMAQVLVVGRRGGATAATLMRWGLVPAWARDPATVRKMHNARAETVASRPSFRDAYRRRRCLIPASGFYEWHEGGGRKQPFYVRPSGGELFSLAGIWEQWRDLATCAVITTDANASMSAVHDRMPVIIPRERHAAWLAGEEGLLQPAPDAALKIVRVSRAVNDGRREGPELIAPEETLD